MVRDQGERTTVLCAGGPHTDTLCSRQTQHDSQFSRVLRDVIRYFGEFLVGAVNCGPLTPALFRAGQVSEAVPSQLTAVIFRTWPQLQPLTSLNALTMQESNPSVNVYCFQQKREWPMWRLWYNGRILRKLHRGCVAFCLEQELSKCTKHVQKTLVVMIEYNFPCRHYIKMLRLYHSLKEPSSQDIHCQN